MTPPFDQFPTGTPAVPGNRCGTPKRLVPGSPPFKGEPVTVRGRQTERVEKEDDQYPTGNQSPAPRLMPRPDRGRERRWLRGASRVGQPLRHDAGVRLARSWLRPRGGCSGVDRARLRLAQPTHMTLLLRSAASDAPPVVRFSIFCSGQKRRRMSRPAKDYPRMRERVSMDGVAPLQVRDAQADTGATGRSEAMHEEQDHTATGNEGQPTFTDETRRRDTYVWQQTDDLAMANASLNRF